MNPWDGFNQWLISSIKEAISMQTAWFAALIISSHILLGFVLVEVCACVYVGIHIVCSFVHNALIKSLGAVINKAFSDPAIETFWMLGYWDGLLNGAEVCRSVQVSINLRVIWISWQGEIVLHKEAYLQEAVNHRWTLMTMIVFAGRATEF